MRHRIVVVAGPLVVALGVLAAAGWSRTVTQDYTGVAGKSDAMSFQVANGRVSHFIFENRCPGVANGTPVAATMPVVHNRFLL
jgi:hypothetical protein